MPRPSFFQGGFTIHATDRVLPEREVRDGPESPSPYPRLTNLSGLTALFVGFLLTRYAGSSQEVRLPKYKSVRRQPRSFNNFRGFEPLLFQLMR